MQILTQMNAAQISNAARRAALLTILCAFVPATRGQQTQVPNPPQSTIPGISPNPTQSDPALRSMTEKMALERNSQRQKQIVADTARLLQLAQNLNAEVSKSNKNELSLSVVKEAEEIEKLAKSIKNRMRDGE